MNENEKKRNDMPFLGLGLAFIGVGIVYMNKPGGTGTAFLVLGIVFLVLGITKHRKLRKTGKDQSDIEK